MLRIKSGPHSVSVTSEGETPCFEVSTVPSNRIDGAVVVTLVIPGTSVGYAKPPLGVKPQSIWWGNSCEARATELRSAITRYLAAGYTPPPEWDRELEILKSKSWETLCPKT